MKPGRGGARGREGSGRRAPADATGVPAPGPAGEMHAARDAGLALVGLAGAALAVYALVFRRVGDYLTEGDFYAGYAHGARELLGGHVDFSRYGVYGPLYEFLLAAAGLLVPDLFTAARLLSVLATVVVLLAWWRIAERRFDALAALVLVALLVVNPTCMRYGYSVTTDMVSMALFSASAWASFALPRAGAPFWAGVLAGLATLTRYNLATLLPAAMILEGSRVSLPRSGRARNALLVLAGFLVPVLPWTLASMASGHVPGATLVADRGFYLQAPGEALESRYHDLGAGVVERPSNRAGVLESAGAALSRLGRGLVEHPPRDARDLLGPPAALLAVAGLGFALLRRQGRRFAPFVPLLAVTYASLAPVYYTERYSMVLAPLLLLPGAWLVSHIAHGPGRRPQRALAAGALALLALAPTAGWALAYHRVCFEAMPLEARAAGEALRPLATPGQRLLARKAHVAFYAGLEPVPFPSFGALPTLGRFCRERSVDWLYFSWYEARMRPAFAFLLDTSAAVPGLQVVHATRRPASVTFRVGPELGTMPAWWSDSTTKRRVSARVNALLQPGPDAAPLLVQLAADGLERGRAAEALVDAEAAIAADPRRDDARLLAAEAHRRLGRPGRAVEILEPLFARLPGSVDVRLALGHALLDAGRSAEAVDLWRPVAGAARDSALLRDMERAFVAQGDTGLAKQARRALGRR